MKEYVAQRHAMSCGVACVANVMECSYDDAMRHFDSRHADTRGYYCKNIVMALEKFGKTYRFKKVHEEVDPLIYQEGTIAFVGPSSDLPYGYWLTRIGGEWIDPWINLTYESNPKKATAGIRYELPGRVEWIVYDAAPIND